VWLVIVEVADQPSEAVYREWKYSGDSRWSVAFWGLQPGTTYAVRVEDNYCTPYAVPDAAFRQLYTWTGGAPAGTTGNAAITDFAVPRPADRFGYCSVAGNTQPDGSAIAAWDLPEPGARAAGLRPALHGRLPVLLHRGCRITCSTREGLASLQGRHCGLTPVAT
jgi:hypothetical protein